MPYDDPWRDSRRIIHQEFRSGPVKRFRPIEQRVSTQFLVNLYRHPEKLMYNLRQYAVSSEILCILLTILMQLIGGDDHVYGV